MSESSSTDNDQSTPKHALRRNLLGRPVDGKQPVKAIIARHRSAADH